MALKFDVTERGAGQAAKVIEDIGRHAVHAQPAMRQIMLVFQASEIALWKRRGGKKWPPHPDGTPAGVDTGALERSLAGDGEGAIREIHDDHMVFGSSLWYAHFMLGTKHQPKRPLLPYTPTTRKKTEAIIAAHLLGELHDLPAYLKEAA